MSHISKASDYLDLFDLVDFFCTQWTDITVSGLALIGFYFLSFCFR